MSKCGKHKNEHLSKTKNPHFVTFVHLGWKKAKAKKVSILQNLKLFLAFLQKLNKTDCS